MGLKKYNITRNRQFFSILQTSERMQTAMMTLGPGEASGPLENDHPASEQVVLVLEGSVVAEVGDERSSLGAGDVLTIPTKVPHRLTNDGTVPAVTFNVYGPPAY